MNLVGMILSLFRALILNRKALAAENLALRQQLIILQRSVKRPRFEKRDRVFWVLLSRLWKDWASCLLIIKPDSVVR
jgi:hypothetical protein